MSLSTLRVFPEGVGHFGRIATGASYINRGFVGDLRPHLSSIRINRLEFKFTNSNFVNILATLTFNFNSRHSAPLVGFSS